MPTCTEWMMAIPCLALAFDLNVNLLPMDVLLGLGVCSVMSTLCDPMYCSLLGYSVHGTSQARILEWVAISYSKLPLPTQGLNQCFPALAGKFFTRVPRGKPLLKWLSYYIMTIFLEWGILAWFPNWLQIVDSLRYYLSCCH